MRYVGVYTFLLHLDMAPFYRSNIFRYCRHDVLSRRYCITNAKKGTSGGATEKNCSSIPGPLSYYALFPEHLGRVSSRYAVNTLLIVEFQDVISHVKHFATFYSGCEIKNFREYLLIRCNCNIIQKLEFSLTKYSRLLYSHSESDYMYMILHL